jgi:hypothetical protein
MWRKLILSAAFLLLVLVPASHARKAVLQPSREAVIVSPSNMQDIRSLVYFEVPQSVMKQNVTVDFAVLKCKAMLKGAPLGQIDVFPLKSDWEDAVRVTWDGPWEKPGGDFSMATGSALYSLPTTSILQQIMIDVTQIVQGWQSGALANHGLILMMSSEDLENFPIVCSLEGDRAELLVFYSLEGK